MPKLTIQRVTILVVLIFIIAGAIIIGLDRAEMSRIIGQANWMLLAPSLLFTGLSYFCLSLASAVVFRAFGIGLKIKDLMEIGFVSNTITYLVNVGGVTGIPIQILLMKKRGLATGDILAPSLFQLYFDGLVLIALLPIGLFTILTSNTLSRSSALGISIAAGILTLLLIAAGVLVFAGPIRSAILENFGRITRFITGRDITPVLNDFNRAMTGGVAVIRHRPGVLASLAALTIADWGSTVTALWFCFYSLGSSIGSGTLLTGFSLGVTAGFVSLVPGGLGVQEGSMAGIYALLGVPIRTAVLAAILFRVVYYFVPFLASLAFYRHLLKTS
jgi:uncharacterized protein (TIRG00374 family)